MPGTPSHRPEPRGPASRRLSASSRWLRLTFACALAAATLAALPARAEQPAVAFYYGADLPLDELSAFDWAVIQPRFASAGDIAQLADRTVTPVCYLSVGELEAQDWQPGQFEPVDVLTVNRAWKSRVMNLTAPRWRDYLTQQAGQLVAKGCQGLFLDTMDSYQLAANSTDPGPQGQALANWIAAIATRWPDLKLIANRGFEILPDIGRHLDAMAAESLFRGWDPVAQTYRAVPEPDRQWLTARLREAADQGLHVIAIDYLPAGDRSGREQAARDIAALGFIPWVTDPHLAGLGQGLVTVQPRRVLALYRGESDGLAGVDAYRLLGAVFDHLGLIVEFRDIAEPLPKLIDGVHRAVVLWLDADSAAAQPGWQSWLQTQRDAGRPILMFASLPMEAAAAETWGLEAGPISDPYTPVKLVRAHPGIGQFEAPVRPRRIGTAGVRSVDPDHNTWLRVRQGEAVHDAVALTDWGGYALHPYLVRFGPSGAARWILDPFAFVTRALDLQPFPVPDTTTETGARILTAHVDGDGFPSRAELPGQPYSAAVLLQHLRDYWHIPHTISVIEGEVGEQGLYPKDSAEFEALAREIFALPHVELASHSFSHPFFWSGVHGGEMLYGRNLPIPGYSVDMQREINGSISYINERLAPADKRVKVFLWSGDADPDASTIDLTQRAGVVNVNGGDTSARLSNASLTAVYPQARFTERGVQVLAPTMNENVYTNNWTGPFYGYRKVIETFQFTESPRRLKPMSIYYHFYSATKRASLDALHSVYDWARAQPHHPLYLSEFAARVAGFRSASIARHVDGSWRVRNLGELRTLRLPSALGWPDPAQSRGVAGINADAAHYVSLTGDRAELTLRAHRPTGPLLWQANARALQWDVDSNDAKVHLRLVGHVPVSFTVASITPCRLRQGQRTITATATAPGRWRFDLPTTDTGHEVLVCQ